MKLFSIQKSFKFLTSVKFALFLLTCLAIASSIGSIIEQEQPVFFYQENYPISQPIFGIITWKFILQFGLDHIYRTWWFFAILIILVLSLISCTLTRQLPIFSKSKDYFFRKKKNSFSNLPFSIQISSFSFLKEKMLGKLHDFNFSLYQKGNFLYGYKGIMGRISPIFVHFSLIFILLGSFLSAFQSFKAQEILPKGEIFHIQNPIQIGGLTNLPLVSTRVNDFWVEYKNNRVHQFYSNLSILDNYGNEIETKTISVNHPFRYQFIDFYQSDWNLVGIRFQQLSNSIIYESPLFPLDQASKNWITWIRVSNQEIFTIVFDQFQNTFLIYDKNGNFLNYCTIGDTIDENNSLGFRIIDILPSTGLQIKYDPTIPIIYLGFGLLMITTCLSYLPYTQIWIYHENNFSWIGSSTNRGKLKLEIEFENFIRSIENAQLTNLLNLKEN